jgi:hypothetical protein
MNRTARAVSVLALVTTASLLTACGGDSAEEAAPATDSAGQATQATSSTAGAGGEAPQVTNPLDATSLIEDPCRALSPSQLDQLGLNEGEPQPNEAMTSGACSWQRSEESLDSVDLSFIVENADGLGALYADKQSNEYFEPTEIAGYPAVYASLVDNRDSGFCDLWVGVNERDVMHFMVILASEKTAEASCGLAADVAEATISTLGG